MRLGYPSRRRSPRAAALLLALCAHACQAFVEPDTLAGIGASCREDTECHASSCINGVCALECESQDDCPDGTLCTEVKLCQLPLKVAFVVPTSGANQDWTTAHLVGAQAAVAPLAFVATQVFDGADTAEEAAGLVQQAVNEGFQVVFGASSDFNGAMQAAAGANPGVQFFTCGGGGGASNHHGYYGRLYEAWYIAGKVAAKKTTTNRLGAVGSYVTPAVVRHINAFTLGALSENPIIEVEVRWMHEWIDPVQVGVPPEDEDRVLASQLLATGCDVISYHGYKRSAASKVAESAGASVIGNNFELACDDPKIENCIGTVYWNWAPLYRDLIVAVHGQQLQPGANALAGLQVNPAESVPNFKVVDPNLQTLVDEQRNALASAGGVGPVFSGPFCTNGQRDPLCVDEGSTIGEDELRGMCWFVDGVVTSDGADPPVDTPATVPAEGDCGGS
jgi:basic membrane lipoprotein Med (substrate-binding protein (PBP1-ABC) superfamily)